jgi:hypothetical protein
MARSLTKLYRADTKIQLFVCNNPLDQAAVEMTGICLGYPDYPVRYRKGRATKHPG